MGPDMPMPAFRSQHVSAAEAAATHLLDRDILSFCARQPHLVELAFTLADHGHIHVGDVARLSPFTVADLAGGNRGLADELQHRFRHAGLDFGLELEDWTPPVADDIEPMLE